MSQRVVNVVDKDAQVSSITVDDTVLVTGGEGYIKKTVDGKYIVKTYHPAHTRQLQGLAEILKAAPDPASPEAKYLAWPKYLIINEHGTVEGVVVPNASAGGDWVEQMIWYKSSPLFQSRPEDRRGTYRGFVQMLRTMCSALRYLNQTGYGHADLSGRNVLCNPVKGFAVVIDLDGLVVPGHLTGDVLGTPGYLAPELVDSGVLRITPRIHPSAVTDRHALAVLIFEVLLWHHPLLNGSRTPLSPDPALDDNLRASSQHALYLHHPTDASNRPQGTFIPPSVLGAEMEALFMRAFVDGLRNPNARPRPYEWEAALKNLEADLLTCPNQRCVWKAFPSRDGRVDHCPLCNTRANPPVLGRLKISSAEQAGGFHVTGKPRDLTRRVRLTHAELFGKQAAHNTTDALEIVYAHQQWSLTLLDPSLSGRVFTMANGKTRPIKANTIIPYEKEAIIQIVSQQAKSCTLQIETI
jgi:DNA-binding helix-hairpin-helix protein with protein kinase domain